MFSCIDGRVLAEKKIEPVCVEIYRHSTAQSWSYRDLDLLQRKVAARVLAGGPAGLILSEVQPVITLGRRTPENHLILSQEALEKRGIELQQTDRGGFATYHGTGQWTLFPVDLLANLTGDPRGVRKVTQLLLEVALEVGLKYDSSAEIRWGAETGVWTQKGKFAAVGVHVEQGVLLHGLSVNGFRTPLSFQGLKPCGLELPVDFLLKEPSEYEFIQLGEHLLNLSLQKFWNIFDFSTHKGLTRSSSEAINSPSSAF